MKFVKVLCILLLAMWIYPASAQFETPAQRNARMAWWREARFGMFIHWGDYARLAGVWDGNRIDTGVGRGIGEWIMYNAKISVADYAKEASLFNPVKFDADAWVRLAKEAGQKYIIITSKHHDGFALFQSKASPFNIVDHTPFKRDVLKELAAACKKHGVKLGFYYSQSQDWHHAGGAAASGNWYGVEPGKGHWDKAQDGSFDDYLDSIALPQVRELLTNYGPIAAFWWDTPVGMTEQRAERFTPLLALQPGIITNNRLLRLLDPNKPNPFKGDTDTPEQAIPATGFKDRDFEVCMTMNDTWGYKQFDDKWKPAADLIRKLVDVASKGGNFLLNVGPDGLGQIPQPSVERLKAMGKWIKVNGEAIYGTSASPFAKLPWGRCTQKPGKLYFHVFNWPANGMLTIPGLKSEVRSARLLSGGKQLEVTSSGNDKLIKLPTDATDPVASVICVELAGAINVDNHLPSPAVDGKISFPLWMADIHNQGYGTEARLGENQGKPAIVDWKDQKSYLGWFFEILQPGNYEITATLEVEKPGAKLKIQIGKESVTGSLTPGGQPVKLGTINIPAAGIHELTIYPVAGGWQPVILRSVTLRPTLQAADTSKPDKPVVANMSASGHMGIQHTDVEKKEKSGAGIAFEPPHYIPPLNFSPGAKYAPEQCNYLVSSSIERAPKGRLWASWYAGRDQEDRFGYTCLATSGDDGKTWSDIRLVIDPDANGPMIAIDNTIWLDPKGHLWMFFVINGIRSQDLIDQGLKNWQSYGHAVYAITTENPDDPNPVWSKPRFICTGVVLNKPIALSSGDWLLPVARWKEAPSIHIVSSADAGKTWSLRGGVTITPPDIRECDEPCIIERKDGSIWVTSRTKNGIYKSSSQDGGRTWSEASKYLPHTVSRFQIRRLLSGNLILLRHGNPQEDAAGRTNLMAFLSDDDGKSWKGGLLLEKEYSSYPDVATQAPDGTIYVSFDRDRSGLKKVLMSRFKESDILSGSFQSPASATGLQVYQGLGKNRENWFRDGRWLKRSWNEKEKPFREGPAAEIDAAPFETGRMNQGVKLFSNRPYVADNIDDEIIAWSIDAKLGLKGQRNFVIAPFEGTKTVKVTKPGILYLISRRNGNEAALISAGFEKCRIAEFILFVKPENNNKALDNDFCSVYQKEVKIGDTVTFGPDTVLFF